MTSTTEVTIVRTGTANLASVVAAVERTGCAATLSADPSRVLDAPRLILPGVGAFGAAMRELDAEGLTEPLRERLKRDLPTLGICLGMQLLCATSEESPGVAGLGLIDASITRFPDEPGLRIPQMGWNRVEPSAGFGLTAPGFAYFANSFCLKKAPDGWSTCTTSYAGTFVSAVRRSHIVGCQFHPELSGTWGAALLRAWLALPASASRPRCSTGGAS